MIASMHEAVTNLVYLLCLKENIKDFIVAWKQWAPLTSQPVWHKLIELTARHNMSIKAPQTWRKMPTAWLFRSDGKQTMQHREYYTSCTNLS